MTDGFLLREALIDSEMRSYSCIMLDEAHDEFKSKVVVFGILDQRILFQILEKDGPAWHVRLRPEDT